MTITGHTVEEEMSTPSSILVWKIPWTEEPDRQAIVHGVAKSQTQLSRHPLLTKQEGTSIDNLPRFPSGDGAGREPQSLQNP